MHFTTSFLGYIAPVLLLAASSAFQLQDRCNAAVLLARDLAARYTAAAAAVNTDAPGVVARAPEAELEPENEGHELHSR
ncbi:hypothetical protein C8A05DRAFT_40120, partial [Staphylotrichum tortipilum]